MLLILADFAQRFERSDSERALHYVKINSYLEMDSMISHSLYLLNYCVWILRKESLWKRHCNILSSMIFEINTVRVNDF